MTYFHKRECVLGGDCQFNRSANGYNVITHEYTLIGLKKLSSSSGYSCSWLTIMGNVSNSTLSVNVYKQHHTYHRLTAVIFVVTHY